jgi:hypothetical protein
LAFLVNEIDEIDRFCNETREKLEKNDPKDPVLLTDFDRVVFDAARRPLLEQQKIQAWAGMLIRLTSCRR